MKTVRTFLLMILFLFAFAKLQAQGNDITWIEVTGGILTTGEANLLKQIEIGNFYMSATEITFDQYDAYCEATGSEKPDDKGWGRGNRPVIHVS
ncbi:hypothetical protein ACFLQ3_01990, partial [Bacteroidota bacterium]